MNTHCRLGRALTGTLALAFSAVAWAAPPSSAQTECGLAGAWIGGDAGGDLTWLGVHTAGTYPTKGTMLMDWATNNMVFAPFRMTPGRGVWEQTAKGQYKYTWYALMVDDTSAEQYRVVVSGTAANLDCDNVQIRYRYRLYDVSGNLVYSTPAEDREPGFASEARLPLVTP